MMGTVSNPVFTILSEIAYLCLLSGSLVERGRMAQAGGYKRQERLSITERGVTRLPVTVLAKRVFTTVGWETDEGWGGGESGSLDDCRFWVEGAASAETPTRSL